MKFNSPKQLKDWLKNKELSEGIPSNTLLILNYSWRYETNVFLVAP